MENSEENMHVDIGAKISRAGSEFAFLTISELGKGYDYP